MYIVYRISLYIYPSHHTPRRPCPPTKNINKHMICSRVMWIFSLNPRAAHAGVWCLFVHAVMYAHDYINIYTRVYVVGQISCYHAHKLSTHTRIYTTHMCTQHTLHRAYLHRARKLRRQASCVHSTPYCARFLIDFLAHFLNNTLRVCVRAVYVWSQHHLHVRIYLFANIHEPHTVQHGWHARSWAA